MNARTEDPPAPTELRLAGNRLLAGASDGPVELVEVQLEGKARMSGVEFARGFQLKAGERVE